MRTILCLTLMTSLAYAETRIIGGSPETGYTTCVTYKGREVKQQGYHGRAMMQCETECGVITGAVFSSSGKVRCALVGQRFENGCVFLNACGEPQWVCPNGE